ncbi:MAG: hypothetical protein H3C51_04840 [Rubellimicrobium sp.]|nr:hypothetical protein [Rubellimicrobium sp.]
MQIAYHIGVNPTDEELLLRALMRSSGRLAEAGVALPGPGRYRKLLRETIDALADGPPPEGVRDILIDAITEMTDARRMVLSNANFFCNLNSVFLGGNFYGKAADRMRAFRQMFPEDELSVFMAIRNPATFIPAALHLARQQTLAEYMGPVDPRALRWSDVVARMRAATPDIPVTLWCNEDAPLIWHDIIARLAGDGVRGPFEGDHALLETIMQPGGVTRLAAYLDSHKPASDSQHRRIISAFLDKYALRDRLEEDIDIPGWDADLIGDLTLAYEADVERIAGIEGVTLLRA